jgi:hypothetical protein
MPSRPSLHACWKTILLVHVFIKPQARSRASEHTCERCLAHVQRVTPRVVAVEFDQVEGVEEDAIIVVPMARSTVGLGGPAA